MNYSDMSKGMLYRIQLIDEFVQAAAPDVERQWSDGESGPGLAEVKCRLRYNECEVLVVITEDSVRWPDGRKLAALTADEKTVKRRLMMTNEQEISEAELIAADDEYFGARPQLVSIHNRLIFKKGFLRGFSAGLACAREQESKQMEERADNLDRLWCSSIAAEILRDQAAKIRSRS